MLSYCTKSLAENLLYDHFRISASGVTLDEHTPLGEWHGHLLILDPRQCVLFCHDLTQYVRFFPNFARQNLQT